MTLQTNMPVHEMAYRKLRDLILFGEIAPGQAVTIQGLVERLEAGMTPVREAIRRLTSEGALILQDNRHIIFPELSNRNMSELYFLRITLEPQLVALATVCAYKKDIVRPALIDADLDQAINTGDINLYLRKNYEFHEETLTAMSLGDAQKAAEAIRADVTQEIFQIKSSIIGNG